MGIFHSSTRLLTSDEEEDKSLTYPVLQNRFIHSEDSSAKLLTFTLSIYNFLKWLLRKVGSILYLAKAADPHPLLPVQNPASTISTDPLLGQSLVPIYSLTSASAFYDDESDEDDDVDGVLWCGDENYPAQGNNETIAREEMMCGAAENGCRNVSKLTEEMKKKSSGIVVVGEERWIKHYSSRHKILLVGEGDFSFSACLAVAFGSAANIIATSLNSEAFLKKNYGRAMSNLAELRSRGSTVMHEIDATEIANHEVLRRLKFDRIIFNFPFAGFFPDLSPERQLGCHRSLVSQFLKNAREMIRENGGEIHISHKTNGNYHREFKLENIASSHRLRLITALKFERANYPGYNTKYGFGGDNNFNCHPSKTFIFGLNT